MILVSLCLSSLCLCIRHGNHSGRILLIEPNVENTRLPVKAIEHLDCIIGICVVRVQDCTETFTSAVIDRDISKESLYQIQVEMEKH